MTDTRRRDARAYLMAEIDRLGEDFGPRSPLGLAINANAITDPRVLPWELYGAVLDILREEFQRHRNRRDGADATARNAQGRDDRRRLAGAVGTGGLPPTPQRGEKDAEPFRNWPYDHDIDPATIEAELDATKAEPLTDEQVDRIMRKVRGELPIGGFPKPPAKPG